MQISGVHSLINSSIQALDRVSHDLAQGVENTDVADDMVELTLLSKNIEIAKKVIQTEEEMIGELLDIVA